MIDGRRQRGDASSAAPVKPIVALLKGSLDRLGKALVRRGVSADLVTVVGVLFALGTAIAVGEGHLILGVALLIVGGLMDTLDGVVAKAAGATSSRGAFLDSVADRVSDSLILGGVAWYFLAGHHARLAILPVAILAAGSLVSYTRAKAESLGFEARGGLMERAERLILLGIALAFHVVLVPLLALLLALTCVTAVGRFVRVWRVASNEVLLVSHRSVEARFRTWRERSGLTGRHRRSSSRSRDLLPLTTRLRGVLRVADGPVRPSRQAARDERLGRALRRRIDATH